VVVGLVVRVVVKWYGVVVWLVGNVSQGGRWNFFKVSSLQAFNPRGLSAKHVKEALSSALLAKKGFGSARTTGADVAQWQERTECLFSLTKRDKTFAPPDV
jgi:hypothetical protein